MTTLEGKTSYGYDLTGQLTSVALASGRSIEYKYDAAGNRITVKDSGATTNYSTNNLNQYTTVSGNAYTYDKDGNLTSKTIGGKTSTFSYDIENRLIGVTNADGTWQYQYDALGNRIGSTFNGQKTDYLLDPTGLGDVVGEYTGSQATRYSHGLGLVSRNDGTNTSFFDTDAIGSVVGLSGTGGNYLNSYSYLPFGESLTKTETVANSFEYVGQFGVMNEANGLDFMRARFYTSGEGRFLNPDPIGVNGGLNLYKYAADSPTNFIDPEGKFAQILGGISLGAVAVAGLALGVIALGVGVIFRWQDQNDRQARQKEWAAADAAAAAAAAQVNQSIGGVPPVGTTPTVGENKYQGDQSNKKSKKEPTEEPEETKLSDGSKSKSIPKEGEAENLDMNYGPNNSAKGPQNQTSRWKDMAKGASKFLLSPLPLFLGIPQARGSTTTARPFDPNDIIGPSGTGTDRWLTPDPILPYTIRFENVATATAPAVLVNITHTLDSDLDLNTFELGDFGFGSTTITVPDRLQNYTTRLDLRDTIGDFVDFTATLDTATRIVTWKIITIDPLTGEPAEGVTDGFLPPNNANGDGDGFVNYRIKAKSDTPNGASLDAQASIVFDTNAPIVTPVWSNKIDTALPSSQVTALPTNSSTNFNVAWTGADNGSGVAKYDIYVSDNGGNFTIWKQGITDTSATYTGELNHVYRFYSVATDNVGFQESAPNQADTSTTVVVVNNLPTVANLIADQNAKQGIAFNFQLPTNAFADIDAGDVLTYSATLENGNALPSWLTFNPTTQTFSGTPTNDNVGNLNVKVAATDKSGANVSDIFAIAVENLNDAPIVSNAIADQTTKQGDAFNFQIPTNIFTDIDAGDVLTYSATLENGNVLPTWLSFNATTRTFTGTPTNENVGNLNVKVTATDKAGANVSDIFAIAVENLNDAPIVSKAIADQTTTENQDFSFTFNVNTFKDIDTGDSLTYAAALKNGNDLPPWLKFNASDRTFSGKPTKSDLGSLEVVVRAIDKSGASTTDAFLLNVLSAKSSLAKLADDIFTISGGTAGKPKLQITISDSNPKSVNDLAVFTVDDAQGKINGIAPTETGYTQAALSRAKNIFSAIANLPNGFDPKTLSRSLEFNSGDNLRFLLVKNDTLDNVRKKNVSNNILFSSAANQKITDSGTGNFTLAWKDGSGNSSDFKDFVVNIQPTDTSLPLGANLQDQQQGEVLDLSSVDPTKTVQANFVVNREAAYNNFVGFYKITDSQGTITDPLTGLSLKPGDIGYTESAIKNRVAGIDLQAANQSTATINGTFQGGSIFAPFIIANGSVNQLLDADKSNDPSVYFAYLGANSDGVDHIRLLANNTFGFEDLAGGGDLDYNDIIIKANLSVV